jgi:hypothetical protein
MKIKPTSTAAANIRNEVPLSLALIAALSTMPPPELILSDVIDRSALRV